MNTAKRLLSILDALLSRPVAANDHSPSAVLWAAAFRLDQSKGDAEDEVSMAVQAFRAELASVIARLDAAGVPSELYLSQFTRLRTAAAPAQLGSQWRGMVGNINAPDVRLALAWAAQTLPDDEGELDEAELAGLRQEFDKLEAAIDGADLPPAMRAFVEKQIGILRVALRMYRVRGVAAVEEALEQTFGAAQKSKKAMAAEATTASPEARGFMQWTNDQIGRVIHVLDGVNKAHKGGSSMIDMAEGMGKALEWIKDIAAG